MLTTCLGFCVAVQVSNTEEVIECVRQHQSVSRVFALGLGEGASHELVEGIGTLFALLGLLLLATLWCALGLPRFSAGNSHA